MRKGTFILHEDAHQSNLTLNYNEDGSEAEHDISSIKRALEASHSEIKSLSRENVEMKLQITELKKEKSQLMGLAKEQMDSQSICKKLRVELAVSRGECEVLKKHVEGLTSTLKEANSRGATARCDECAGTREKLEKTRGQLLSTERHAETLRNLLAGTETTKASPECKKCPKLLESLVNVRAECEASKRYAEEVSGALGRLESRVQETCTKCEEREMELKKLRGQLTGSAKHCESLEKIIENSKDAECKECPGLRKTMEILNARVDEKAADEARAKGIAEQARMEIERLLPLRATCASQSAKISMMQPYYEEYKKRLEKGKNAVVGAEGERGVKEILASLLGSHSEISVTNKTAQAGDLQVVWTSSDVHRPLLLTVEVKTSDGDGMKMVRKDYVEQARTQVQAQGADAGLLLYSHSVHSEKRLFVEKTARLVVCGNYNQPGQVLSGLLHALLLARARARDEEGNRNPGLSEEELRSTSVINRCLVEQNRVLRGALSFAGKSIDKTLKGERERTVQIVTSMGELSAAAAKQYPYNARQQLSLDGERLLVKRPSGGNGSPPEKKQKPSTLDCFRGALNLKKGYKQANE